MAFRRALVSFIVFPVALFPAVRLKSRSIDTASGAIASPDRAKAVGALLASEHRILEFAAFPSRAQLQALEDRGAHVLQYVPDNAVMVNLAPGADLEGLGVRWTGTLEPSDKVSPALAGVPETTAAVVEFHPDVDPVDARWAVVSSGAEMIFAAKMARNHLLARVDAGSVRRLAERDEVAYVFPAPAELERGETAPACEGAINTSGSIGQYASSFGDGWDGPGLGATTLSFSFANSTDKVPEYLVQTGNHAGAGGLVEVRPGGFFAGNTGRGPDDKDTVWCRRSRRSVSVRRAGGRARPHVLPCSAESRAVGGRHAFRCG